MDFNRHPLWKFSLTVYGAPGVSAACLELQERRGADVNLLLFAAFAGASGRGRLTAAELAACAAAVAPWSAAAVRPLRQVRRALKADLGSVTAARAAELRRRLAALEIEAEQLEQMALADRLGAVTVVDAATQRGDAVANMRLYLSTLAGGDATRDDAALTIVSASLPPSD